MVGGVLAGRRTARSTAAGRVLSRRILAGRALTRWILARLRTPTRLLAGRVLAGVLTRWVLAGLCGAASRWIGTGLLRAARPLLAWIVCARIDGARIHGASIHGARIHGARVRTVRRLAGLLRPAWRHAGLPRASCLRWLAVLLRVAALRRPLLRIAAGLLVSAGLLAGLLIAAGLLRTGRAALLGAARVLRAGLLRLTAALGGHGRAPGAGRSGRRLRGSTRTAAAARVLPRDAWLAGLVELFFFAGGDPLPHVGRHGGPRRGGRASAFIRVFAAHGHLHRREPGRMPDLSGCIGNTDRLRSRGLGREGGYVVGTITPTAARRIAARSSIPLQTFSVLAKAGFRRYSTYRQATMAGIFTNSVFGFLRCFVLTAVAVGGGGTVAGYGTPQLVAYVWIGQGLIGTVGLWGDTLLSTRIRTGDIVSDLLRPIHPIVTYLATDLGRAAFALVTRFIAPIIVGVIAFDFYLPRHAVTYPLFALSVVLAVVLCFGCRYIVNATAYWLLDGRGPQMGWSLASTLLGGLYFPLRFLPGPLVATLWLATPFPSLLQAPLDIAVERVSTAGAVGYIAIQLGWVIGIFVAAAAIQRKGERKLVAQGG